MQEILDSPGHPTTPLFAAVLSMSGPEDTDAAERSYSRGRIGNANFDRRTHEQLLYLLPPAWVVRDQAMVGRNYVASAPRTQLATLVPADAVTGRRRFQRHRFSGAVREWRLPGTLWLVTGLALGVFLVLLIMAFVTSR